MIQIIFMVLGVVYLFRLIGMNKQTGSHLGLDEAALAAWQSHRRKQYIWMIAAGWGSLAVSFVAGFLAGAVVAVMSGGELTRDGATVAQIATLVISLIAMLSCYAVSSGAGKQAKELEARAVSVIASAQPGNP